MTFGINRRHFLSACGSTLALAPFARSVLAQTSSDYRALVIVFQTGGVDCHDTVLPYDTGAYNAFAEIRAPLLNLYGQRRERNALLPLETSAFARLCDQNIPLHGCPIEVVNTISNHEEAAIRCLDACMWV